MSDKRYEANIIRSTAVEPANNLESTSAPGVWSIDEVVELQKKSKWPTVGNVVTNVDSLFSTFLYIGQGGSTATINNGIDLLNEGGLVWIKARNATENHVLFDTDRGVTKYISSNLTNAEATSTGTLTHFYNNGFKVDGGGTVGSSTDPYVSWTFRKQAKFFDVVTYTGNGSARTISHNLGSVPGMIILKNLSSSGEGWRVYHRGANGGTNPEQYYAMLQATNAFAAASTPWNNTAPTSTEFTLGTDTGSNGNGNSFVAYLFAHNNNDGGFGPDQDEDIIKCGSFTSDSSGIATVNLGFEPQWVLFKGTHAGSSWFLIDVMRGMTNGSNDAWLAANLTNTEGTSNTVVTPTATGFVTDGTNIVDPSSTFIYVAIRRPQAAPTAASQVFGVNNNVSGGAAGNILNLGFVPDMNINTLTSGSTKYLMTRLIHNNYLRTDVTNAQALINGTKMFDAPTGTIDLDTAWWVGTNNTVSWSWARARGYFDVCCYTGTGSARTVAHNLGVAPEMMWVKTRDTAYNWTVFHSALGNNKGLYLNSTAAAFTNTATWNNTAPTSTVFSVNNDGYTNKSGDDFIAYLFATVANVSKVGSYTGNGSSQNIDCGFSSGARFVLIKCSSHTGAWHVFDTARGIVSGNDPFLELNSNSAQDSNYDAVDPLSSGFTVSDNITNENGRTFIFYAIA